VSSPRERVGIACLGNRFRGDDGVGLLVADRLRAAGVDVQECQDEPTRLLDSWRGLDRLVLVDAVRSGAAPGTVHRIDASSGVLPRELGLSSSHLVGLAETLALARALDRLPPRVVVYGVEGAEFGASEAVTAAVAASVESVAADVLRELG
jgi:hydrogenase maturation protease